MAPCGLCTMLDWQSGFDLQATGPGRTNGARHDWTSHSILGACMKAALFATMGTTPVVQELPDPVAEAGEIIVDVVAAPVLAYANEVFSGARPMLFELPFVPGTGAIGRASALGPGSTALRVGDWVYVDPTLRGRDGDGLPAIALQGLTAGGPDALPLLRRYGNGSWSAKLRLPIENAVPLGEIDATAAGRWLTLGSMLVPYGGLLSIGLQAGETVVVNGATGNFGSAAVTVALALGAGRVVATGRDAGKLAALANRHGERVGCALMPGDEAAGTTAIRAAAGRPIDVVLDILPPAAAAVQARAAIRAVRPGGRVVLMGGVGMTGGSDLALPYPWIMRNNITIRGQWMYPRDAIPRLIAMARSGVVDLSQTAVVEFPLDALPAALAHAAASSDPFSRTVLRI